MPKFLKLTMQPASSDSVPAGGAGAVTQSLRLENSAHGAKALALRLKFGYDAAGAPVTDQVDVKNFPPTL